MLGRQYCPKCRGEIYIDHDFHGWFVRCRECAYTSYLRELDISEYYDVEVTYKLSQNEVVTICQVQDQSMLS